VNNTADYEDSDSPRHYCGLAAVYAPNKTNIPSALFFSLFALQHRGQESAGIAYEKAPGEIVCYKNLGMVSQVLSHYLQEDKSSRVGIGHVRYSTKGGNKIENAQPLIAACNKGMIAVAHNGTISNADEIKAKLFASGAIFQSSSDTELILHLISTSFGSDFYSSLKSTLRLLEGAFSITMIHDGKLILIRDPMGFRPLYLGKKDGNYFAASETCAFDIHQVKDYREIEPGEIVVIGPDGEKSERFASNPKRTACIFELIYFARPDSNIFGWSVHEFRKQIGARLAAVDDVKADMVIPVPDSGNSAALGYSQKSGIPFEFGLTRNHYSGRSFIMPTTQQRELAIRIKLNPIHQMIKGKKIILVDDSLVRGTTSGILVKLVREAGAAEIHLRLASPEIHWPCFFGIDIPTRKELISNTLTAEQIAKKIGADSVKFLPLEQLDTIVKDCPGFCDACFSGKYPIPVTLKEE
jgi:amidophosphoribosyltransferase